MVGGKIKPRTPNYTRPAPALPMHHCKNTEEEKNTDNKYRNTKTLKKLTLTPNYIKLATILPMQKCKIQNVQKYRSNKKCWYRNIKNLRRKTPKVQIS